MLIYYGKEDETERRMRDGSTHGDLGDQWQTDQTDSQTGRVAYQRGEKGEMKQTGSPGIQFSFLHMK